MCRFNIAAPELRAAILEPWSQERWIEFGERKWSPHQASLTVIEGPRIPFAQLTMGRGWRAAQRGGREVTEELLAALAAEGSATHAVAGPASAAGAGGAAGALAGVAGAGAAAGRAGAETAGAEALAADSLGLELLSRVGSERAPLRLAWELADERHPGSPPSATLALAERAVESLLRRQLIVLSRDAEVADAAREAPPEEREIAQVLGAIASWADGELAGAMWVRRA